MPLRCHGKDSAILSVLESVVSFNRTQVDGKQVSGYTEQEICSQILGPHGSCVVLTIRVQEGKVDSKVTVTLN